MKKITIALSCASQSKWPCQSPEQRDPTGQAVCSGGFRNNLNTI